MNVGGKKVEVDKCTEDRVTLEKYKTGDYCRMQMRRGRRLTSLGRDVVGVRNQSVAYAGQIMTILFDMSR